MNLYHSCIPQMTNILRQARTWLDKAQALAEQKKFDPEVLLGSRLAPDQWALWRQLQSFAMASERVSAMLTGVTPPQQEMKQENMAELRARFDRTLEALEALKPEQFEGAEERMIGLPFMPGKGMLGSSMVLQFALPNFYFHAAMAYAILRHNGVELGKMDFLGQLDIRDM